MEIDMTLMVLAAVAMVVDDDGDCNNVSFLAILYSIWKKKMIWKGERPLNTFWKKKKSICSFEFTSSLYGYYYVSWLQNMNL